MAKPVPVKFTDYVAPPLEIKHVSAGFNAQLSDSFWMRSNQDNEYCEKHKADNLCVGNSWFYHIVLLTVELDPAFSEAYYYGALALTIIIKDIEGASDIFDRATIVNKYDWPMLYLAAYHALFEEHNKLKAADLYLRAANNGAPSWVRLSAGQLAAEGGDRKAASEILQHLVDLESDPRWVARLKEKLKQSEKK